MTSKRKRAQRLVTTTVVCPERQSLKKLSAQKGTSFAPHSCSSFHTDR